MGYYYDFCQHARVVDQSVNTVGASYVAWTYGHQLYTEGEKSCDNISTKRT